MKMKDETIKKLKKKIVSRFIKDKIQGSREASEEREDDEATVRAKDMSGSKLANGFN